MRPTSSTVLFFLILSSFLFSQECNLELTGRITDSDSKEPLNNVHIYIKELQRELVSDTNGNFKIDSLCIGNYHITLNHINCEPEDIFLSLTENQYVNWVLQHQSNLLDEVTTIGSATSNTVENIDVISSETIASSLNENLAYITENITGVSSLKNGNQVAKPIVHGLYGNRLTILNNGIPQSGQQWGNDHSPEIDPLIANQIKVIKGTGSIEYMGSNLGAVILVEPGKIKSDPHLHGKASYFYQTNGRAHGVNAQLQQYNSFLPWKINGTLKQSGDNKAPDYFLNNTGSREANLALQLEKKITDKWNVDFYGSTFNAEFGVLRGSHISNITDLESALQQEVPFFTEEDFSYSIDPPRQTVNHHLLKLNSKYKINDRQYFEATLSSQFDTRKEYDVRRGGRSDIPALDLQQNSFFGEIKYKNKLSHNLNFKVGGQFNGIDNKNDSDTGIFPLIPDYLSNQVGTFAIVEKKWNRSLIEAGLRYDYLTQDVSKINIQTREVEDFKNTYSNINTNLGYKYKFNPSHILNVNIGYITRNPAINELYSEGLHQGIAGIEVGDPNLKTEKAFKSTISYKANFNNIISFNALAYFQNINDYIYLNPSGELRTTIRGTFPVFNYQQTDANLYGIDFSSQINLHKNITANLKYSYIRGEDNIADTQIPYIPYNNFYSSIYYQFDNHIKLGNIHFENLKLELNNKYVYRQDKPQPEIFINDLTDSEIIINPPSNYNLFGFGISSDIQLNKLRLKFNAKAENIFNESYRDYLNRLRYFADDIGSNYTFGLSLNF